MTLGTRTLLIRQAQPDLRLLGHKEVRTTMVYTHVLNRGDRGVRSSVDFDSFYSE